MFDQHTSPPPFPIPQLPFNPRTKILFSYKNQYIRFIFLILAPLPPPPFFPPPPSTSTNPSNFIPPPFPLPPPEFLSQMLQTPPPPLPVPPPVNNQSTTATNANINDADLYDPLKVEDEDEHDNTEHKKVSPSKTVSRTFNIKKEYTIKIEPRK